MASKRPPIKEMLEDLTQGSAETILCNPDKWDRLCRHTLELERLAAALCDRVLVDDYGVDNSADPLHIAAKALREVCRRRSDG